MRNVRIISEDQFSKCTTSKEMELTKEKINEIEKAMLNGSVYIQMKNGIRYEWVITEVELLN